MNNLGNIGKFNLNAALRLSKRNLLNGSSVNITTATTKNEIPSKCDAVIIGGGSLGCSTLYHLNKNGMKNVVLLEKNQLTSGTTWHTAGLVWSLRPSDIDIQLLQITRSMLDRLEDETGINPGWNVNGGLFLASTKERLDEYKRLHTIGKAFGISSEVLSPADTKKRFPLLDESTLYGTIFSPKDGNVDPTGLCNALTRYATNNGGKVFQNCQVTGIRTTDTDFSRRVVKGVDTNLGFIETPIVVNCAGAWSTQVCNQLEIQIPLIPMKHSYIIFDKIDEVKNMPNLRDHDEAVYFRIQGDTLSVGGYEINPILLDNVEETAPFGLYELDWDVFGTHINGAIKRIPMLKNVGIKSTICGPESFTPDHKPIMGEDPLINGFYHGYGFNSAGMMFGGGCGSQLAKWILTGHPDLDMFAYDIRRFLPKLCKNKEWAKERSHEAYAKNYSIVYKNDEPLGGRNQLLSPLHHVLAEDGCMFQERQGWERAGYFAGKNSNCRVPHYDWYGQYGYTPTEETGYAENLKEDYTFEFSPVHKIVRAESMACRNTCAIFDMSYFGKFFLTGPEALKAAQYIFTNDMDRKSGNVIYTCFLNKNGGTEADLTVTAIDNLHRLPQDPEFTGRAFYLAVGGTTSNYTYSSIWSLLAANKFDAQLIDRSEEYGMMSIQGPKSINIMSELFKESQFQDNAFRFSTHQIISLDKVKIRAMRVSFVGELGWELHVPKQHCISVYNEIMRVGEKYGIRNAGYRAIDSLSIEKGYRHWHADLRSDDTPLEASLGFTCKLKSNINFVGRQALETQLKTGLHKKLVCFTLEGDGSQRALWGLETIWDDNTNEPIGYLRRADYAFTLEKSIGYGYVNRSTNNTSNPNWIHDIENGKYSIEIMGEKITAKAHLKSPFDPKNLRVKGSYHLIEK